MTSQELRERAAQLIEERGWRQGPDRGGGKCLWIGLIESITTADDWTTYVGVEKELLTQLQLKSTTALIRWNDAPGRTQAEVLAALRGKAG